MAAARVHPRGSGGLLCSQTGQRGSRPVVQGVCQGTCGCVVAAWPTGECVAVVSAVCAVALVRVVLCESTVRPVTMFVSLGACALGELEEGSWFSITA